MATQEIKQTNWDLFCKRFEEAHRGTPVTLQTVFHDGRAEVLATQSPLRTFKFEKTTDCSDGIRIELGEVAERLVQHQIIEPIHVRVREQDGSSKALLIDAEAGSVELRFSSGKLAAILQDLAME